VSKAIISHAIFFQFLAVWSVGAQDFDADSIYYTPIPRISQQQERIPKNIFADSTGRDRSVQYFFNVQMGPLIGCQDCESGKEITFSTSTLHGVTIGKKLRIGLGSGLDSYNSWVTMPAFGSVGWDLAGTKNSQALFVQLNYGWSVFTFRRDSPQDSNPGKVSGGRMISPQIGYRIKYHDLKISIALGSKHQRVFMEYEIPNYYYLGDGTLVVGSSYKTTIKESMNRFMLSLAVGWK